MSSAEQPRTPGLCGRSDTPSDPHDDGTEPNGSTFAIQTPFAPGNPVVFTVTEDPRPGLWEGKCAFCGWMPMTARRFGEITEDLAFHVTEVHGVEVR